MRPSGRTSGPRRQAPGPARQERPHQGRGLLVGRGTNSGSGTRIRRSGRGSRRTPGGSGPGTSRRSRSARSAPWAIRHSPSSWIIGNCSRSPRRSRWPRQCPALVDPVRPEHVDLHLARCRRTAATLVGDDLRTDPSRRARRWPGTRGRCRCARGTPSSPAGTPSRPPGPTWPSCGPRRTPLHVGLGLACVPRSSAEHDRTGVRDADAGGRGEQRQSADRQRRGSGARRLMPPPRGRPSGTSGAGSGAAASPARRGRVSRNWAPSPGRPHACSQPPCRWVSSSEIDRPRPVPPLVRARAGSARQKRLKTIADSPGAQADAVVADRDRAPPGRRPPTWTTTSRALGVVDGVGDQVAHDPLHPSYVGLGEARVVGGVDHHAGVPLVGQRAGSGRPPGARRRRG